MLIGRLREVGLCALSSRSVVRAAHSMIVVIVLSIMPVPGVARARVRHDHGDRPQHRAYDPSRPMQPQ